MFRQAGRPLSFFPALAAGPHVRAAKAYFRYAPEEKKALLAHRILIKARKYGVHVRSEEILEWASKYSK